MTKTHRRVAEKLSIVLEGLQTQYFWWVYLVIVVDWYSKMVVGYYLERTTSGR